MLRGDVRAEQEHRAHECRPGEVDQQQLRTLHRHAEHRRPVAPDGTSVVAARASSAVAVAVAVAVAEGRAPPAVAGGAPAYDDLRSTSSVASTTWWRSRPREAAGRRSAISVSSRSIIARPISSMGWRTLVSGGSMWRAMAESS